jgi:hypothetical protein
LHFFRGGQVYRPMCDCAKLRCMNAVFTPIESEFSSAEQEQAYDRWLTEKVAASLAKADDPLTPRYSTDEVMRRMDAIVQAAQARHASSRLA